ncbi:hypothetical protein [Aneurinibacillus terranovensis]|uniref:hypothetical protein n=1 Tax=Aneurinibacillus terranovensis TaxID=278991 RepID=UPI000480A8EB|nr:hypothetical protein [Aneurinibacillus terranovensis]
MSEGELLAGRIGKENTPILRFPVRIFLAGSEIELERTMEFTSPFVYKQSGISGLVVRPERMMGEHQGIPDVGRDEINALVYRLRKRLGKYGEKIVIVPRSTYGRKRDSVEHWRRLDKWGTYIRRYSL